MAASTPPALHVLVLVNGMAAADVALALEEARSASKSIGTHKRRQLFWDCYTKMAAKTSSLEGAISCFMLYSASPDGEGEDGKVELVELTKRQRGLVGGGIDIMGRKLKASECEKGWVMLWDDDAQEAWDDLMHAEPCIYVKPDDGIYVATRCASALAPHASLRHRSSLGTCAMCVADVAELHRRPPGTCRL